MARKVDPLKAKQAKQKKIAIAATVVFVAVLAFSVPRTLKMMHRSSAGPPPTPPAAVLPAGTPSLAAPTLSGTEPVAASSGTAGLASATGPSSPASRLQSFGRFETKDPFQQQLSQDSGAAAPAAAPAASAPATGATTPSPAGTSPVAPAVAPSVQATPAPVPAPTSAVISVNGTPQSVTAGSDFPQPGTEQPEATPYFHLVSLTAKTAKISISGGSYSSGARTVTLRVNKPVTLVNTADGTRYRLVLMAQGTQVPASGTASGTTP